MLSKLLLLAIGASYVLAIAEEATAWQARNMQHHDKDKSHSDHHDHDDSHSHSDDHSDSTSEEEDHGHPRGAICGGSYYPACPAGFICQPFNWKYGFCIPAPPTFVALGFPCDPVRGILCLRNLVCQGVCTGPTPAVSNAPTEIPAGGTCTPGSLTSICQVNQVFPGGVLPVTSVCININTATTPNFVCTVPAVVGGAATLNAVCHAGTQDTTFQCEPGVTNACVITNFNTSPVTGFCGLVPT